MTEGDRIDPSADQLTPGRIRVAMAELVELAMPHLPARFPPDDEPWRVSMTALLARTLGIARSIGYLAHLENEPDGLILVRSLYEHVVRFCWLAVDPAKRMSDWRADTLRERLRLHHDMKLLNLSDADREILTPEQLSEARQAKAAGRSRDLAQLALDADRYWFDRVKGLREPTADDKTHLLSLRGLYVAVYRVGSQSAHGTLEAMDYCAHVDAQGAFVIDTQRASNLVYSALAVPLIAIALVVSHEVLGWPDEEEARKVNDAFARDVPDDLSQLG